MMLTLLQELDQNEYEIYVISKPGGPLVEKVKSLGYHYLPVKSLRRNLSPLDLISFFHIFYLCRKHRFDIVHTHSSKTGFIGRIAARLSRTPKTIHTVHGFPFHAYQPKIARYLYLFLEMIASWFCDFIPVVNRHECEWAKYSNLFPKKKLLTIYNAVESTSETSRKYGEFGIVEPIKTIEELKGFFAIGYVGRFTRAKNILTIVESAITLCSNNSTFKFVLIGDGELWEQCKRRVEESGFADQIMLPGWQTNIDYWLTNIDLFLLYSHWEGLPISILEAMAQGIPVVASDIKGNNELVGDDNGVLVPIDAPEILQDVLTYMPERRYDLERWSRGALLKTKEKFGLDRFVAEYERLYRG